MHLCPQSHKSKVANEKPALPERVAPLDKVLSGPERTVLQRPKRQVWKKTC